MKSSSNETASWLFFANFAKLMTSLYVLLKLLRKCFFEIFYNILLFEHFFFLFSSSGKGGGFLSKYKKIEFLWKIILKWPYLSKILPIGSNTLILSCLKRIYQTKQVLHFQASTPWKRKSHNFYYYDLPCFPFQISIFTMSHRLK